MYCDAYDVTLSNWLRFINCPRHVSEENVQAHMCYGRMYYRISRDVAPGTELLVDYGEGYKKDLGIDVDSYYSYSQQDQQEGKDSSPNRSPQTSNKHFTLERRWGNI